MGMSKSHWHFVGETPKKVIIKVFRKIASLFQGKKFVVYSENSEGRHITCKFLPLLPGCASHK